MKTMKRWAIAGLLGLSLVSWGRVAIGQTPPATLKSRYQLVDVKQGDVYYLDRQSVQHRGAIVYFNLAVTTLQSNGAVTVIRHAANCQRKTYQTLSTVVILNQKATQVSGVEGIETAAQGTLIERAIIKACAKR